MYHKSADTGNPQPPGSTIRTQIVLVSPDPILSLVVLPGVAVANDRHRYAHRNGHQHVRGYQRVWFSLLAFPAQYPLVISSYFLHSCCFYHKSLIRNCILSDTPHRFLSNSEAKLDISIFNHYSLLLLIVLHLQDYHLFQPLTYIL